MTNSFKQSRSHNKSQDVQQFSTKGLKGEAKKHMKEMNKQLKDADRFYNEILDLKQKTMKEINVKKRTELFSQLENKIFQFSVFGDGSLYDPVFYYVDEKVIALENELYGE